MLKAFKYRLLPNTEQAEYIKRTIGSARFVYNWLLNDYKEQLDIYNKNNKQVDKPRIKEVTEAKKDNDFLSGVDSLALANAKLNLNTALRNFFDSRKGKRKGRKIGFPKPHKKMKSRWSYTTNNQGGNIRVENGHICLPKIKWVKLIQHRELEGEIRSVTVSMERNGDFYVSVLCNVEQAKKQRQKPDTVKVVGLDMSYTEFVVDSDTLSDDTKPKYVRQYRSNEKKRSRLNRAMSRKTIGSRNRDKARVRLAKLDRHIANCRTDFAHKMSRHYAENYDVVVIEDIDMQSQARKKMKGHGKSANDLGWGQFKSYLKYKCEIYGSLLVVADKWFASSKTCNSCGTVNHGLTLYDREWTCPECGATLHRDYNAACNLRDWYFERYNTVGTTGINACGDSANTAWETLLQAGSLKQEAPSFMEG